MGTVKKGQSGRCTEFCLAKPNRIVTLFEFQARSGLSAFLPVIMTRHGLSPDTTTCYNSVKSQGFFEKHSSQRSEWKHLLFFSYYLLCGTDPVPLSDSLMVHQGQPPPTICLQNFVMGQGLWDSSGEASNVHQARTDQDLIM